MVVWLSHIELHFAIVLCIDNYIITGDGVLDLIIAKYDNRVNLVVWLNLCGTSILQELYAWTILTLVMDWWI